MSKKIISRESFEDLLKENAKNMSKDQELIKQALDVKVRAG